MIEVLNTRLGVPLKWEEMQTKEERLFKATISSSDGAIELFASAEQIDALRNGKRLFTCEVYDCPSGSRSALVERCVVWLQGL